MIRRPNTECHVPYGFITTYAHALRALERAREAQKPIHEIDSLVCYALSLARREGKRVPLSFEINP